MSTKQKESIDIRHLEFALEASNLAWWEMDCKTGAVRFHRRKTDILGYKYESFKHYSDFTALLHPDDYEPSMQAMRDHILGKKPTYQVDYRIKNSTGEYIWFQDIGKISDRDEKGNPLTITGMVLDITERKRLEESLEQSEYMYRLLSENTVDGISLYEDNIVKYISNGQLKMLGYDKNEMENISFETIFSFIHKDDVQRIQEIIKTAHEQQTKTFQYSFRIKTKELGYIWVEDSITAEYDGSGKHVRSIIHSRDITERKRLQETHHEIIQTAMDGFWIADMTGHLLEVNETYCRMSGYNKHEILKMRIQDLTTIETVEETAVHMKIIKEKGDDRFESRHRRKDGSTFDVEVSVQFQPSEGGRFLIFVKDITMHKTAEKALQRSQAMLTRTENVAHIGSWSWDVATDTVTWSDEMFRITAQDPARGTPSYAKHKDIYSPKDMAKLDQLVQNALNEGVPYEMELTVIRPGDDIRICQAMGFAEMGPDGKVTHLFGTLQDITERKQSEKLLLETQKRESIVALAGGIAHNFNNLLLSMIGNVELAKKRIPFDSPAVKNLERSFTAMQRAATLTKQMLFYSGKGKVEIIAIDLEKTVEEHIDLLEASLLKNVRIAKHLSPTPVTIKGDPSQIEQIVINVLMNAGEAIGEQQGIVDISVSSVTFNEEDLIPFGKLNNQVLKPGEYALLQVTDNGIGMDEETLAKIFDPFFTTKFVGRGLGLAAVLGIVRGHNGGIMVESKKGIGTTFKVIVPVHTPVIEPLKQKVSKSEKIVHTSTVLLIDDEQFVIELTQDIFSDTPYQLLIAKDPTVGVMMYREQWRTIDVVILDYSMPKMNGKEVLIELQKINPTVKVIMSSGYSEEELARLMSGVTPTASIGKPHTQSAFLSKISEVLEMK